MLGRALAPITLALLAGAFACLLAARPAMTLPDDFEERVVTGVPLPTALAFLPPEGPGQPGRMLVTSKTGELWVYRDGALLQSPALDMSRRVCSNSERGLLGVAVDPSFGTTGHNYVYLYYTFKKYNRCP